MLAERRSNAPVESGDVRRSIEHRQVRLAAAEVPTHWPRAMRHCRGRAPQPERGVDEGRLSDPGLAEIKATCLLPFFAARSHSAIRPRSRTRPTMRRPAAALR